MVPLLLLLLLLLQGTLVSAAGGETHKLNIFSQCCNIPTQAETAAAATGVQPNDSRPKDPLGDMDRGPGGPSYEAGSVGMGTYSARCRASLRTEEAAGALP